MNQSQISMNNTASHEKKVTIVGWILSLLLIANAFDLVFSIIENTEDSLQTQIQIILSLVLMLYFVWGVLKKQLSARIPLILFLISNVLFCIYNIFILEELVDGIFNFVIVTLVGYYLLYSANLLVGRKLKTLQGIVVMILIPSIIFPALSIIFQDEVLKDDSALQLNKVVILDTEENISSVLLEPGNELPKSFEQVKKLIANYPESWNQQTAEVLLTELKPYVNTYVSIAKQGGFQCPTSVNDFSMQSKLCKLNPIRDYAELMKFAAITEAKLGNSTLALDYALSPINAGFTITQSDNVSLIQFLVGLASINIGLDTINLLKTNNFPINSSVVAQVLQTKIIPTNSLTIPFKREYLFLESAIENIQIKQSYLYHPNQTRNILNQYMTLVINNNQDCLNSTNAQLDTYITDAKINEFNFAMPNIIGRITLNPMMNSFPVTVDKLCEVNAKLKSYTNN